LLSPKGYQIVLLSFSETEKLINENELEIQELVAKHAEKLRDDIAKKSKVQINCIDTMKTQIAEKILSVPLI
jgi:hypothetical protein